VATRADVAKLAGVSASSVTYALSGSRPISDETKRRIFDAMDQLGYTPNAMAAGLAGKRSYIIALQFPAAGRAMSGADLSYVIAAADAARELGYQLLMWPTHGQDIDSLRDVCRGGLVDAALLMEIRLEDERIDVLESAGIPFGLIGRTADPGNIPYADADFETAATMAVDYLRGLGHESIAFINGPRSHKRDHYGANMRIEKGVLSAAKHVGMKAVAFACEHAVPAGRDVLVNIVTKHPDVTAIVTFHDEATIGVVQAAQARGLNIPGDLSLMSLASSTTFAEITLPPVTTLSPPAEAIGRAAARALIREISDQDIPPEPHLWVGEIVERASTGPAPRAKRSRAAKS